MAATFFFGQDVNLGFKLGVWCNRALCATNLTTFDVFFVDTSQKEPNVVSSLAFVKDLSEHFDTSDRGGLSVSDTYDFNLFAGVT